MMWCSRSVLEYYLLIVPEALIILALSVPGNRPLYSYLGLLEISIVDQIASEIAVMQSQVADMAWMVFLPVLPTTGKVIPAVFHVT